MAESELFIQIGSFVKGYHEYMDIWNPVLGEELPLWREPENAVNDKAAAVTVLQDSQIIEHVAQQFSSIVFHFLARPCNRGIAKVTDSKINCGAGYGLKKPCVL